MMWRWLAIIVVFLFCGLDAEGAQQIRFRNLHERTVQTIAVGDLTFESIPTGKQTEYQDVEPGQQVIRGQFEGQGYIFLDGTVAVPSDPDTKWTVVLMDDRKFQLVEDVVLLPGQEAKKAPTPIRNRVRFVNRFADSVAVIRIGPITHRNIGSQQATRYLLLAAEEYEVTGQVQGFGPASITGTVDTTGYANRKLSVVFDERGIVILEVEP